MPKKDLKDDLLLARCKRYAKFVSLEGIQAFDGHYECSYTKDITIKDLQGYPSFTIP